MEPGIWNPFGPKFFVRRMFLIHKPNDGSIARFISTQRDLPLTYSAVGASRNEQAPAGYNVDHNRIQLGHGEETFGHAVAALRNWKHFDLGWLNVQPPAVKTEPGAVVAVQAFTFGLWSLNACRIVYVIEEEQPLKKFGFAYGTLPDHVESGEERFTIEFGEDGVVSYDIYAFSRPRHKLARLGFPITRRLQRRCARESLQAMMRAVGSPT